MTTEQLGPSLFLIVHWLNSQKSVGDTSSMETEGQLTQLVDDASKMARFLSPAASNQILSHFRLQLHSHGLLDRFLRGKNTLISGLVQTIWHCFSSIYVSSYIYIYIYRERERERERERDIDILLYCIITNNSL